MLTKEIRDTKQGHLISACLELSDYCRVGCPYCLLEEKKNEISEDYIFNTIRILKEFGVERYTIGGGEPLEVPYVYDVGRFIKKYRKSSLLRTSACIPIDCTSIHDAFDLIDISIDSNKKDILSICKPNVDPNIIFQNIENLVLGNIDFRCNILVTQYNYADIISTIKWLAQVGVKNIRIQKLVSRGKARSIFNEIYVSEEEYNKLLQRVQVVCNNLNIYVEEVKTVNSQTLCIVKPNGMVYVGTPNGLIEVGHILNKGSLDKASEMVYKNQMLHYGGDNHGRVR